MLKISAAQRESIKLLKPRTLSKLSERIGTIYDIDVLQLVLTYENDKEDLVLLDKEEEYSKIVESDRDYHIRAYIQPISKKKTYIIILASSLFLTYGLMKYATIKSISVSVGDNSGYLAYLFYDIFSGLFYVLKELFAVFLWIPYFITLAQFGYFTKTSVSKFAKTRALNRTHLIYLIIIFCNLIPSVIGYVFTMSLIIWFTLGFFHVLLHRPKPRTEKDKSFLKILSFMIITGTFRLNNFT